MNQTNITNENQERKAKCFQIAKNLGLQIINERVQIPIQNWYHCRECASTSFGDRALRHSKSHRIGNWSEGVSVNYISLNNYPEFTEYVKKENK